MTRKCFFIEQLDSEQEVVSLVGPTAHHLENVLRVRSGDSVELRDGRGNGWHGVVVAAGQGQVRIRLTGQQRLHNESSLRLTLALAFARAERMELVLRQATELGVQRFVAFRARRSQYTLSGAQKEKRLQRWIKIAREAMCQCGRMRIPEICIHSDLPEFISNEAKLWGQNSSCLKLVATEREQQTDLATLRRLFERVDTIVQVIGPEGGWDEHELSQFKTADFQCVHLGPRILRLETAAVAFIAASQLLWGDLSDEVL